MPSRAYTVTVMVTRTIVIDHEGEELNENAGRPGRGTLEAWQRLYAQMDEESHMFVEDLRENVCSVERDVDYELEYEIGDQATAAAAAVLASDDPLEAL